MTTTVDKEHAVNSTALLQKNKEDISRLDQKVVALNLSQADNLNKKEHSQFNFNDDSNSDKEEVSGYSHNANDSMELAHEMENMKAQFTVLEQEITLLKEKVSKDTMTTQVAVAAKAKAFVKNNNSVCAKLESALDLRTWAPVRYHKDLIISEITDTKYNQKLIDSIQQDDDVARSTIAEFNRINVLTKELLDAGVNTTRGSYPARRFAERVAAVISGNDSKPLQIAVFGSSFTAGHNCGESTFQSDGDCAWPNRLTRRWEEHFPPLLTPADVQVDWHMLQEHAQGSVNIAQKLPAFIESFRSKNVTPDAILLDNTLIDSKSFEPSWFEVVIRALVQTYPGLLIVSIVDGISNFVNFTKHKGQKEYYKGLRDVQRHYGLTVVNIAHMARVLKNETSDDNNNEYHQRQDRLWPQSKYMVNASGHELPVEFDGHNHRESYWANFVPRVRKTKFASHSSNHPPWPTHQYVADTVAYALLRTTFFYWCSSNTSNTTSISQKLATPPASLLPKDTVSPKAKIDACPICLDPLSHIDAKVPPPPARDSNNKNNNIVNVVCGDWKWVTDDRDRAGWQSDEAGSLIRFRLQIGATPLIAMTYMASHLTFGDFQVTFRMSNKTPLVCEDISNNTLPSLKLDGRIPEYSLSKTVIFPAKVSKHALHVSKLAWELLNATVLSQKKEKNDDYVDLYVQNIPTHARTRVKIQMITTC